jgi:hypothetical protein
MKITDTHHRLLAAVRLLDGTPERDEATKKLVQDLDGDVAASAAWLARRAAGHLNSPGMAVWDARDDEEADRTLNQCERGAPTFAMALACELALHHDDVARVNRVAELPRDETELAWAGCVLVRLLASMTGDVDSFLDAMSLELLELATWPEKENTK